MIFEAQGVRIGIEKWLAHRKTQGSIKNKRRYLKPNFHTIIIKSMKSRNVSVVS